MKYFYSVAIANCWIAKLNPGDNCHQTGITLTHLATPSVSRDRRIICHWTSFIELWVYLMTPGSECRITEQLMNQWVPISLVWGGKKQSYTTTFVSEIIVLFPWFLLEISHKSLSTSKHCVDQAVISTPRLQSSIFLC